MIDSEVGVPRDGMQFTQSNKTALAKNAAKIFLNCEICGLGFWRFASHAKRNAHHYCGRGCLAEGQKRPVKVACTICGTQFITCPSRGDGASVKQKRATCSLICEAENRRRWNIETSPRRGNASDLKPRKSRREADHLRIEAQNITKHIGNAAKRPDNGKTIPS